MEKLVTSNIVNVSRRNFIKGFGVASGAFVVGGILPLGKVAIAGESGEANELNVFVSIHRDNTIDIICHRSEMGQGVRTSVPQIIADELEADWDLVNVVQGMANEAYGDQNTDGSTSIRSAYFRLRKIGASARQMLVEAGAKVWKVPASECIAKDQKVTHTVSGKTLSYGQLAPIAAEITPPAEDIVKLKEKADFKYIGKGLANIDLPDIVNGTTTFGQDVQLPGMVIASIERSPVIGGQVKSFDDSESLKVKGVLQTVKIDHTDGAPLFHPIAGVAVIASHTHAALKARQQLKIDWDLGANQAHNSAVYLAERKELVQKAGKPTRFTGDVAKSFEQNKNQFDATYTVPYLVHAPMEPPAAVAQINDDGTCDIWACTQAPQRTREVVAGVLGLKKEQVNVHVTLLGGAFGRKSKPDFAAEAAVLAKAVGKPVKVVWSREDDIKQGYYHAISAQYYRAALDDNNQVDAWLGRTSFPSIGATFNPAAKEPGPFELALGFCDMPFDVKNIQLESCEAPAHLRIGWMRSVSNIHHGFAVGSFVDELAHHAGQNPKDFLLSVIGNDRSVDPNEGDYKYSNYGAKLAEHPINTKRLKHLVNRVCDLAGWNKKLPEGEGLGLSVHRSFLSYVAVISHVKVTGSQLVVKKMFCVADAGVIANIDRVHAQMEGGMVFGLSIALMNEISVKNGAVEQSNFHDYPMTRMNQSPEIVVEILENDELPGGVGEPGVPPVMSSITNAIFAATGERIRDLPLNKKYSV